MWQGVCTNDSYITVYGRMGQVYNEIMKKTLILIRMKQTVFLEEYDGLLLSKLQICHFCYVGFN